MRTFLSFLLLAICLSSRAQLCADSTSVFIAPAASVALTDADLAQVAAELEIEEAALRAVIDVEAGPNAVGFWCEGSPLICFSFNSFQKACKRKGIALSKYKKQYPELFRDADTKKYGSLQAARQARLDAAMAIDSVAAIESTFWGMFQIGGFNWKACGAESPADFYRTMRLSERAQLELFANFVRSRGMDQALRKKQWSNFALKYNGKSYAKRGYHKKLEKAYKKYK